MALNTGKILMRRGQEVNFDPDKMSPGEWAVSLDTRYVRMCFAPGICVRMATYEAFEADLEEIQQIIEECRTIEEVVTRINDEITDKAEAVAEYTEQARRYRDESKQYRDESQQFLNSYSENILDTLEEIDANTQPKKVAGALAVKEISYNLGGLSFGIDGDGNYGYYGADGSLVPFNRTKNIKAPNHTTVLLLPDTTQDYIVSESTKIIGILAYNNSYIGIQTTMYIEGNILMNGGSSKCPIINYVNGNVMNITTFATNSQYVADVYYE